MSNKEIKIKLQVQNQKANKALKQTGDNIEDIEKNAKRSEKELGRMRVATAGLRRTMGALRNNLLLVTFAFGGVAATIAKSVKLFGEQEKAEKKLETALGRTSKALLDQASALQSVTAFGDENIIQAQALIAAFTDDEEAIKRATEATLDLAAAKGMDLFSAADLVAKTLGSTTNAMSRYGIEVTGAVGSTERLDTLTKNVADTFGGQAKAEAETMAGAIQQASNAAGDASEKFGQLLEPVIKKSAIAFKGAAEAVGAYLDSLRTLDAQEIKESTNIERLTGELRKLEKDLMIVERSYNRFGEESSPKIIKQYDELTFTIKLLKQELQDLFFPTDKSKMFMNFEELRLDKQIARDEKEESLHQKYLDRHNFQFNTFKKVTESEDSLSDEQAKARQKHMEAEQAARESLTKSIAANAAQQGFAMINTGKAMEKSAQQAVVSEIQKAVTTQIGKIVASVPFPLNVALAGAGGAAVGSLMQGAVREFSKIKLAETGMNEVVTSPTLIMAGENNKAESVQITPLESPNINGPQGSTINVSVSGNVMTQDFVENDLAEAIKEATRRGTDFGVG